MYQNAARFYRDTTNKNRSYDKKAKREETNCDVPILFETENEKSENVKLIFLH